MNEQTGPTEASDKLKKQYQDELDFKKDILSRIKELKESIGDEAANQLYACELIGQAGIMLKLPQVTMLSAQMCFHRFYRNMKGTALKLFHPFELAMTCLYLACKTEETIRKESDIIIVFSWLQQLRNSTFPPTPLDRSGETAAAMLSSLNKLEFLILEKLGFIFQNEHIHKYLYSYVNFLDEKNPKLLQLCWNYVNDIYRSPFVVQLKPEIIASAAVFLGTRKLAIKLPSKWYEVFGVTKDEVIDAAFIIMDLYELPEICYVPSDAGIQKLQNQIQVLRHQLDSNVPLPEVKRTGFSAPGEKVIDLTEARSDKKEKSNQKPPKKKFDSRDRRRSRENRSYKKRPRKRSRSRRRSREYRRRSRSRNRRRNRSRNRRR